MGFSGGVGGGLGWGVVDAGGLCGVLVGWWVFVNWIVDASIL